MPMPDATPLESVLRHDRHILTVGLGASIAIAWGYQVYMDWGMRHGSAVIAALMPIVQGWTVEDLLLLFLMWVLMMLAMMLPSVAPTILAFAAIQRRRREEQHPYVTTGVFVSGYLAVWIAFSAVATAAQLGLHATALLSPAMVARAPAFVGALLIATGIFQWTPVKEVCLSRCRSPLGFLLAHWREGTAGAFRLGLRHGGDCVGCCALLMALMFVNGVMNVGWMALITAFILAEKLFPAHRWTARIAGTVLCGWGIWVLARA